MLAQPAWARPFDRTSPVPRLYRILDATEFSGTTGGLERLLGDRSGASFASSSADVGTPTSCEQGDREDHPSAGLCAGAPVGDAAAATAAVPDPTISSARTAATEGSIDGRVVADRTIDGRVAAALRPAVDRRRGRMHAARDKPERPVTAGAGLKGAVRFVLAVGFW